MRLLGQQLHLPPVQELVQGGEGVLGDGTLVHITPHLQAHQGHTDVQSPVELQVEEEVPVLFWLYDLLLYSLFITNKPLLIRIHRDVPSE